MGKGKLVFKGDKPKKKKKSSKRAKHVVGEPSSVVKPIHAGKGDNKGAPSVAAAALVASSPTRTAAAKHSQQSQPRIEVAKGRITTSGTVLTGHGTCLQTTLRPGDAILATLSTGSEEMRVITMVLSEMSGAISTPFSADLKVPTDFRFIRKPRDVAREKSEREKKAKLSKEEEERSAFGLYGTGSELVYRETTEHGSYRIRREKVGSDVSRGDLLLMRTTKKSDKYC